MCRSVFTCCGADGRPEGDWKYLLHSNTASMDFSLIPNSFTITALGFMLLSLANKKNNQPLDFILVSSLFLHTNTPVKCVLGCAGEAAFCPETLRWLPGNHIHDNLQILRHRINNVNGQEWQSPNIYIWALKVSKHWSETVLDDEGCGIPTLWISALWRMFCETQQKYQLQ